jgi:hypothetical protein
MSFSQLYPFSQFYGFPISDFSDFPEFPYFLMLLSDSKWKAKHNFAMYLIQKEGGGG